MFLDNYWRAYTHDVNEAYTWRIQDRQIDYYAIKNNLPQIPKWIQFFTYVKWEPKRWFLPPSAGRYNIGDVSSPIKVWDQYTFQPHQLRAMDFISKKIDEGKRSCMVISGTASWKSRMILGVIAMLHKKTVVVVPTLIIGKGIYEKISPFVDVKMMTAQKYRTAKIKPDVVILSWSSFNNVYDSLQDDWYKVLIMDEQHHLSKIRIDEINLWRGDFICGFTATPERKAYGLEWFEKYFGSVFDTEKQSLPVHVLKYDYQYNYSIEEISKSQEWLSPESPEFYRRLYAINDDRTNHLSSIIGHLKQKGFKKIIIFTDRRAHVDQIQRIIPDAIRLTWDENIEEFNELIKPKDDYLIVALSQCAWEGFDLPALECWILFVSSTWINTIDQTAGRMRRYSEGKTEAVYIDFVDTISFMWGKKKNLWRYGRHKIYKEKGWIVEDFENFISLDF